VFDSAVGSRHGGTLDDGADRDISDFERANHHT
jgi:hypothetical protein